MTGDTALFSNSCAVRLEFIDRRPQVIHIHAGSRNASEIGSLSDTMRLPLTMHPSPPRALTLFCPARNSAGLRFKRRLCLCAPQRLRATAKTNVVAG